MKTITKRITTILALVLAAPAVVACGAASDDGAMGATYTHVTFTREQMDALGAERPASIVVPMSAIEDADQLRSGGLRPELATGGGWGGGSGGTTTEKHWCCINCVCSPDGVCTCGSCGNFC